MTTDQTQMINQATITYCGIRERALWGGQKVKHYILHLGGVCFSWYCGLGHTTRPTAADIIGDLAREWRDARDCGDLESFLCEFGYNENEQTLKNGKKIFEQITNNNSKLAALGFRLCDLEQFIID